MKQICLSLALFTFLLATNLQAQENSEIPVLMVLDVQENFVSSMKKNDVSCFIEHVNSCIKIARPMDIVFITSNSMVLSISFKGIKVLPAENQEIETSLYRNKDDRIYNKEEGSAFSSRPLVEYLEENGINTVYLVGLYGGKCISATSLDGEEQGFQVKLIEEGVAFEKPSKKEKILSNLEENGVDIIAEREFEELMKEQNVSHYQ